MTDADKDMDALDLLFAEARQEAILPDDALMSRILADAAAAMPTRVSLAPSAPAAPAGWRNWISAMGGWPAMGGIAMGTVAGVWIGLAPPTSLTTVASGIWGETVSLQLYPDDDPLGLLEG